MLSLHIDNPVSKYNCNTMNIVRSWREQKAMLKRRFPILTDEDFNHEPDDKESMFKRLEQKLQKTRDELEFLFAELQKY